MRNAGLEEAQAGIKIAGRNINNLRFADGTTVNGRNRRGTEEPPDESEREKVGLKLNIQKTKIMVLSIQSHHFIANRWGNSGNSVRLFWGGLQNHCRW